MSSTNKDEYRKFDCKACGICCQKVFKEVPLAVPEAAEEVSQLDRGDGQCINFDFEANKCRIYATRPWFCNGYEIWKRYYKPEGVPLSYAYAIMKKQCEILAVKDTLDEDDIDFEKLIEEAMEDCLPIEENNS